MIGWTNLLDRLRGKAVTIPPLDGPFFPNALLDDAKLVLAVAEPDGLVVCGGDLLVAAGRQLLSVPLGGGSASPVQDYDVPITAFAGLGKQGLVIGLDDGRILCRGGRHDGKILPHVGPDRLTCPTAIVAENEDAIVVTQGSALHRPRAWAADLLGKGASGSVWRIDLTQGAQTCLASDLAFPNGLLIGPDSRIVVAEAWRHRLVKLLLDGGGSIAPVLTNLPGYPARLSAAGDGGAWLALFAPRNRLVEFVLQEDQYRAAMLREIDPACWIAPALSSGASFLEPLQCGGVRVMGIHKPWSPARSGGLLARLDEKLQPQQSFQSRANGARHGVTAAIQHGARLFVASKGGHAIVELEVDQP